MQHCSFVQLQLPRTTKSSIIVSKVSANVIEIWLKSGIPTATIKRVQQKVESLHNNLRMILKRKGETNTSAVSIAKQESVVLLEIAACNCLILSKCTCSRKSKVPEKMKGAREIQKCQNLSINFYWIKKMKEIWFLVLWITKLLLN